MKYFVQDKDQNEYTENKNMAVTVEGTVGEAVVATKKNVVENNNVQENNGQGFTVNVKKSSLFGVVKEDGSLELKVYYDRNTYAIDYNGLGNATHSNPSTYVYGNAVKLTNPVGGEEFQGWYLDDSYTQQISEIAEGTLGNIVLYEKFKKSQPATTKPAESLVRQQISQKMLQQNQVEQQKFRQQVTLPQQEMVKQQSRVLQQEQAK